MSKYMWSASPYEMPPESNDDEEEALLLKYESEAKGTEAKDDDELLNSDSEPRFHPQSEQTSGALVASPAFSISLYQDNNPAVIVGAGLENLGNTCFLNSVMQCFIHTVPLLHGVLSDKHSVHSNCNKESFCILCALQGLIRLSLTWKHGSVAPLGLVNNLRYFSSGFQRFQQEDAHEFLQCFLDRLESCHDSSQSDNIVKQVFGGCLVSKLKCCACGHCSDTYEPSIDLSLEIEDADNLLTALQSFTKVEKIEDPETKFTCEKCKEQVSVEKQLSFDQAPSVAVFQLKRFKNDGCVVHKIDKHVAFPLDLDLLPFTADDQKNDVELKYVLYAIVVHVGLTSTSGHYYCFIRLSPNMWCKFDDSRVVLVSEEFVLSQEAYILFYAKEGTSWFSGFIETQKFLSVDSNTWNTSPKSVLDRVDTSPLSPNSQNKFSGDSNELSQAIPIPQNKFRCSRKEASHDIGSEHGGVNNNSEIKSSGQLPGKYRMSTLIAPPCANLSSAVPSPYAHKVVSPTSLENVNRSEETCLPTNSQIDTPEKPLRSPSPEIYREDPPDAGGYSVPHRHLRMVHRTACKRRLEKDMDDETRQACSFIKKSMPGSRGQQMLAALRGFKNGPSVNGKKSRKSGHDDSRVRPASRPLVAGTHR